MGFLTLKDAGKPQSTSDAIDELQQRRVEVSGSIEANEGSNAEGPANQARDEEQQKQGDDRVFSDPEAHVGLLVLKLTGLRISDKVAERLLQLAESVVGHVPSLCELDHLLAHLLCQLKSLGLLLDDALGIGKPIGGVGKFPPHAGIVGRMHDGVELHLDMLHLRLRTLGLQGKEGLAILFCFNGVRQIRSKDRNLDHVDDEERRSQEQLHHLRLRTLALLLTWHAFGIKEDLGHFGSEGHLLKTRVLCLLQIDGTLQGRIAQRLEFVFKKSLA